MTSRAFLGIESKAKDLLGQKISERLALHKCRFIPCFLYMKTERDVFVTKTVCYPAEVSTGWISDGFSFSVNTGEQGKCEEGWMASLHLEKTARLYLLRMRCSESQREYALNFSALHQCSFNWWSSQLKGQRTLCSKFLLEWKSWQGETCTKNIVLLKFVQSDSCQISLKWNWKGKTNFLWGQSSAHLLRCTCLICFPVKEILTRSVWKCTLYHYLHSSESLIPVCIIFIDSN